MTNSKHPLPIRVVLAFGGACVAGWLGSYAVISWYRASKAERDDLTQKWLKAFLVGGE